MKVSTSSTGTTVVAIINFTQAEADYAEQELGGIEEAVNEQLGLLASDFITDAGLDPWDDECEHNR